jgi:hypothetical protein
MRNLKLTEKVRITELDAAFAKVLLLRTEGMGMPGGGLYWSIPSEVLPAQHRKIGASFTLISETLVPENDSEMKEVGKHPPKYSVE